MEKADQSLLGSLEIRGESIRRDFRGNRDRGYAHHGSSRILTAKAYVPMLDEEFEA